MPKFVSGSSGDPYAHDKLRVSEEDEILSVISRQTTQDNDSKKPSAINKKGAKEKQKSSLDLFKEELRRLNEERDKQRNKLKNSLDGSSAQSGSANNSPQVKAQQPVPLPLRPDPDFISKELQELLKLLIKLMPTKASVGAAMLFCINHSDSAEEVIKNVEQAIANQDTCSPTTKIAQLFLISDILHNSSAAVTNASFYRKGFQVKLLNVFEKLGDFMRNIEDQVEREKFKKRVLSVLSSWNYFHIYESDFLVELSDILLGQPYNQNSQSQDRERSILPSTDQQQAQQCDSADVDGQLDGELIDDATLAKCLESRGLSLRWYKTLELSDDELDEADEARATASRPSGSPSGPRSGSENPGERVRFKASKWEVVNQEEEEPKSPSTRRLEPIRTITASELHQQQLQKQAEVASSADEYESLNSSDESNK